MAGLGLIWAGGLDEAAEVPVEDRLGRRKTVEAGVPPFCELWRAAMRAFSVPTWDAVEVGCTNLGENLALTLSVPAAMTSADVVFLLGGAAVHLLRLLTSFLATPGENL